jgi:hypothetical protein
MRQSGCNLLPCDFTVQIHGLPIATQVSENLGECRANEPRLECIVAGVVTEPVGHGQHANETIAILYILEASQRDDDDSSSP